MKVVHIFNWNMSQSINYDKITVIGDSYAKNVSIILLLKNIQLDLKKRNQTKYGIKPMSTNYLHKYNNNITWHKVSIIHKSQLESTFYH